MKLENSELENKYGVVWQFIAENKKESSEWNSLQMEKQEMLNISNVK